MKNQADRQPYRPGSAQHGGEDIRSSNLTTKETRNELLIMREYNRPYRVAKPDAKQQQSKVVLARIFIGRKGMEGGLNLTAESSDFFTYMAYGISRIDR